MSVSVCLCLSVLDSSIISPELHVALAMRRQTSVVYPPTGSRPKKGDEHPAYTPRGVLGYDTSFTFLL